MMEEEKETSGFDVIGFFSFSLSSQYITYRSTYMCYCQPSHRSYM